MRMFQLFAKTFTALTLALVVTGLSAQEKKPAANQPSSSAAAAGQPIALLSITNLDRLLADITYMMKASNVPEFAGLVQVFGKQYTEGLDATRPLGLAVSMQGPAPSILAFVPVSDRGAFFDALAGIGVEPDDLGKGVFEIAAGGNSIFVKDQGGWLHIAQSEEALANVPSNPAAALGDLPSKYDLAVKVNVQALPAEARDMITSQIRQGFERSMAEQRGQSEEEKKAAREMGEASLAQMEQTIQETEQFIFAWAIDPKAQHTFFDTAIQFLEGSKFAKQADAAKSAKSNFTKLMLPNPAVSMRSTTLITDPADKLTVKNSIRTSIRQAEQRIKDEVNDSQVSEALVKFLNGMVKVFEQSIDEGVMDVAMSASVEGNSLKVLLGGHAADGKAIAKEVQDAVKSMVNVPNMPKFEFDYATHGGMALHRTSIPVQTNDDNVRKMLGEQLKVTIATGDKAVAVSIDPAGDASLKTALDAMKSSPGVAVSPVDGIVKLGQIIEYVQHVSPNSVVDNMLQTIKQYAGKDTVKISSNVIPRGMVYRITIDEGVLRTAGAAAKAGQNGGGF